ncbi:PREDICTED: protein-associating with the carboxyl-terminal domain of ezrin [Nicrophorus vespilloides]|uniref:Protein-associating with the carboxyl-terminal domain of ezrin n=1 Tax=Nicrophorus vespilloides TaxID=110193 RepID=A0ABM1M9G3_NICVS|nr:PREDICTED: protein-associating with the carboxyl-terminal domain of ezrin [Nicrophorus vespilloides]
MGNDQSRMAGMQVEEKAVEVTDFWSHHRATFNTDSTVSVFIGEPLIGGSLWISNTPLEKASKNLMIHRHPCILKYISSWSKGSKFYLAVENVKPLSHMLGGQSTLQICVGLHSILKALVFLHETAEASHNNVCTASIYITKDGAWKLGGLEYLCKFRDTNADYLCKSKTHRYSKAIDPNEIKNIQGSRKDCVDIYAFAVLVNEVFKKKTDETVPSLTDFLEMCKNDLHNVVVTQRPKLSALLDHPFFNHEFIYIHSFLTELPLKSDGEKDEFFGCLTNKLRGFNEATVASQLGALLLSRMVLLNKSAQAEVIPYVLSPRPEEDEDEKNGSFLFGLDTFRKHIVPKLLDIFRVRDAQIRLLLLEYLNGFMTCFSKDELQSHILPELLVGIKDTNDHLVAVTLRSLADLVPILGSATVIGGNRARLFNDGRPMVASSKSRISRQTDKQIQPIVTLDNEILRRDSELPERPSPDGEEGESSTDEVEITVEEEDVEEVVVGMQVEQDYGDVDGSGGRYASHQEDAENWDDWGNNDDDEDDDVNDNDAVQMPSTAPISLPDIAELDIKNQKHSGAKNEEEIDFFQDMEPVIEASSKFVVDEKGDGMLNFEMKSDDHQEDGWGDDDDGWDP